MTATQRPNGRTSSAARHVQWGLGLLLIGVRYGVRRVPLYRRGRHMREKPMPDLDRALPGDPTTVQRARSGVGPLYHRRYWVVVTDEQRDAEELIALIADEPNRVAPTAIARFETPDGDSVRDLQVGDEVVVRLPGPWNGPVRVVERGPTWFRLVTLRGHMEAGEIEFRAGYDDRGFLEFEINSWARSADRMFRSLYERFPVGREMQLHTWSLFCEQAASVSGGVRMSNVSCATRRFDE